ncbi:DUF4296 domain-containing protein [Segetibacter koreensis]|uniref:DUF4296 domain-containing protein n=1 Tax=Segetibacter koreensis TaxID=398037 RepID=UPI0003808869|nr:DUF4296 domain-containing protein [Segetibacter koreensis]
MKNCIYICLTLIFIGCSHRPVPKEILPPDSMEKIVYDLLKVDEYINNYVSKDTTANIKMKRSIFYEQIFKLHSTTRKEFYTSYRYYQQHPDIQKTLFDSVSAKAARGSSVVPHVLPVKPAK